jgi:starch-binding outer membrane protein, SusD/RagB family
MKKLATIVVLLAACDLDVPDLNNPGIGDLETNPSVASVTAASTGLVILNRRNYSAANGYVSQLGILGRESYNFDSADPRFIGELLAGTLNKGSPFGGNFWAAPYANIRLANTIQRAVDKVPEFSAEERAAVLGFSHTIEGLDLLEVINTHDTNGAVIDTDKPLGDALGAIVSKEMVLAEIAKQLDAGATELATAGDEFPFALSMGYAGFDTPETFLQFNRAIRARVAIYQKDYATALTALAASFIDETPMSLADLDSGVYHSYSTSAGDATNALLNRNIYAHPSITMEAQAGDMRLSRKTKTAATAGQGQGLSSTIQFTLYTTPATPTPIITNEELLLLRAEAKFFSTPSDVAGAYTALNAVRTTASGLAAVPMQADMATFVTHLLYERQYSLLFKGHRWIDLRRFMKALPLDNPDHRQNVRYPIPGPECNARPNEPACALGST